MLGQLLTQAATGGIKGAIENKGDKKASPLSQGGSIHVGGFTVQPYEPQWVKVAKYGVLVGFAFILIKQAVK